MAAEENSAVPGGYGNILSPSFPPLALMIFWHEAVSCVHCFSAFPFVFRPYLIQSINYRSIREGLVLKETRRGGRRRRGFELARGVEKAECFAHS